MIGALFDEIRRTELCDALKSGSPIVFRMKRPKIEEETTHRTVSAEELAARRTREDCTPHPTYQIMENGLAAILKQLDWRINTQKIPDGPENSPEGG